MNDLLLPLIGVLVGVGGGLWLYGRFAGASSTAVAVFGLLRNLFLALTGLFLIIGGGWLGLLLGVPFLMAAIFLGSGHADNLSEDESLRKRLAG